MTRSIQSLPNNSNSTSIVDVYTSAGFNAGDPVIFQNGDYKSPANITPPTSANFNFPNQAAINPNGIGGIIAPSFSYAQMQTSISGGARSNFAAILTNGNIVQVWINHSVAAVNPNSVYFRVVNTSGAIVISPTLVSNVYKTIYSSICVASLDGGGFAVAWINSVGGTTDVSNYAIYSNTGSLVLAATQDTTMPTPVSDAAIKIVKLTNGGFVIAIKNNTNVLFRAYTSLGVAAHATVTSILAFNRGTPFALVSRNDNSVFICDRPNTTSCQYALYDSTGSAIVSPTNFGTGTVLNNAGGVAGADASVLSNGTTIVIAYYNFSGSFSTPVVRFLPTGNTLSSEIVQIPAANMVYQTEYCGCYISVLALSSNNYIILFSDGYGNMMYAFYNSSGVCISGLNSSGALPYTINGGFANQQNYITLIESNGFVNAYWTSSLPGNCSVQQFYCKINTSTYLIAPFSYIDSTPYTSSGNSVSGLALSNTVPNGVSYYSSATSTYTVTNTPSILSSLNIVSQSASDCISSCTLPNGNFIIVWRVAATYISYANIYSPTGSVINSIVLGSGYAAETQYGIKVAALSSGKFVVARYSAADAANISIYSGSTLLSQITVLVEAYSGWNTFNLAGLQDDKFVFAMINYGSSYAIVYNSSLTELNNFNTQITTGISVASNSAGGFGVSGYSNTGRGYMYAYEAVGANTWQEIGQTNNTSWNNHVRNGQMCATESGSYICTGNRSGAPSYFTFNQTGANFISSTSGDTSWPLGSPTSVANDAMMGIGLTGNGNVVLAISYSGTFLGVASVSPQLVKGNNEQIPYRTASSGTTLTMFSISAISNENIVVATNSMVGVIPNVGNNVVITYLSTGNKPAFSIYNATQNTINFNLIAGVTPSSPVPITPISGSDNIKGVLAGIAVSSALPNSTGQLAIQGQVQLGSSYTGTLSGSFDQTGQAVNGVRGTYNGRSVNLQGNS